MKKTWRTFLGFFLTGLVSGFLVVTGYDLTPHTILLSILGPLAGQVTDSDFSGIWEVLKAVIPAIVLLFTGVQLYRVYSKGSVMLSIAILGLFSGIVLFFQPVIFLLTFGAGAVAAHLA